MAIFISPPYHGFFSFLFFSSIAIGSGVEVAILDTQGKSVPRGDKGEVCVRGKTVTKGYHNNPQVILRESSLLSAL